MKVIQPNCRIQFTAADIDFMISALGAERITPQVLGKLMSDPDARDMILDDEMLYRAIQERPCCLKVSSHFYFYILVRRALLTADIDDRAVSDYVAEMLTQFMHQEPHQCVVAGRALTLDYFFEMLAALQSADDRTRFILQAHIGNQSLFMSGVFPERIRARAELRGFPSLSYYEDLGISNFRRAGDHRLAQRYDLTRIYHTLSERFHATRLALNDLADRIFTLADGSQNYGVVLGR